MEFHDHATYPGVLVLVADNHLDSYDSADLVGSLQRAIDAGSQTLIVDCARLGYVSTIALCTLILLHKRLTEHGGELRLAAVQAPLRRVLGLTRLDTILRAFPSVDEAAQAPPQPPPPTLPWRSR